jgi:ATP-dependent RNA helicase HelY
LPGSTQHYQRSELGQAVNHACSTARRLAATLPRVEQLTPVERSLQAEIAAELGPTGRSLIDPTAGALPHNGDMLPAERRLAEALYQRTDGPGVIVATPTLAQGMNLPAQVAILAGNKRHDEEGRAELEQHELLNAAGRAGRAGHLANGTVLLVPEPVVSFDAADNASAEAVRKLQSILPANDQCVSIDDPLTPLLDHIQAGALEGPQVRYMLSRLRAGEEDDAAADAAVTMVRRSLAAFRARASGEEDAFERKIGALQAALAADGDAIDRDVARISAFTGLAASAIEAAAARLERDLDAMPTTIVGWSDWIVDFLAENAEARSALLGRDTDLIQSVTRGKKTGGAPTAEEFDRLKAGLRAWIEGRPFDQIEVSLGVAPASVGTCGRARDLVLKLANRRLYMLAAAVAELGKVKLAVAGREAANPAVLEILAIAFRRGFDTPEKAAFAHRRSEIRTRVGIHRAFQDQLGAVEPLLGQRFREVLEHVDNLLLFAAL